MHFAFTLAKGFVLVPLYLKYIDPRLYGAWLASGSLIAALGCLEFGLAHVVLQNAAESAGRRDTEAIRGLVGTGLCTYAAISVLPLLVGSAAAPFLPDFIQVGGTAAHELSTAIVLASAGTSLGIFFSGVSGILRGLQRQILVSTFAVVGLIVGILVTVVLLYAGYSLVAIPLGNLVGNFLASAGGLAELLIVHRWLTSGKSLRFETLVLKGLLKSGFLMFLGGAVYTLGTNAPNMFLARVFDPALCNVYTFTLTPFLVLVYLIVQIPHALVPGIAHLVGEKRVMAAKPYTLNLMKYSLMAAGFLAGGSLMLNNVLVDIWVGERYYAGDLINAIFCLNLVLIVTFLAAQNLMAALGKFAFASRANAVAGFLQLGALLVLGYYFGLTGVAISVTFGMVAAIVFVQLGCLRRTFDVSLASSLKNMAPICVMFSGPLLAGFLLRMVFVPSGLYDFVAVGTVYSLASFAYYYVGDADFRRLVSKVISKSWLPRAAGDHR